MQISERRTPAGYPHPERERHHLNAHRNALRRNVLDAFDEAFDLVDANPKRLRADLARIWIDYGKNDRPSICATWIDFWTEGTVEPMAQNSYCPIVKDLDCEVGISLYDDFFSGMSFINDTIELARQELDGDADSTFSRAYESEGYQRSIADRLREREYATKCADRLREDPTGFKMLDVFTKELSLGRWRDGFCETDMNVVIQGANMAKTLYKAVYPLTVGLGTAA